jgi:hypothetical protein
MNNNGHDRHWTPTAIKISLTQAFLFVLGFWANESLEKPGKARTRRGGGKNGEKTLPKKRR